MKKQNKVIQRIGLIGNVEKPACGAVLAQAATLIAKSGREAFCDADSARLGKFQCRTCPDTASLAREVDLIIVLGGDGTMLRVASEIAGATTPLLGINLGGLGFLTAVPSDGLREALQQVWAGKFSFEKRALICARYQSERGMATRNALNDMVLSRGTTPRLIELEVRVNKELLTNYRCDGLIVSSPTGSTAYSLAAGGAVVSPSAEVFAITPICPHTLSNRSVIVNLDSTIVVKVINPQTSTILSADGQVLAELNRGDSVEIKRSRHIVRLIKLNGNSFFETLRAKLHWRGANF